MTSPSAALEAVNHLLPGGSASATRQAIEAALQSAAGLAMENAAHKDAAQTQQTAAVNAQPEVGLQQLTAVASTPLGTLQAQSSGLAQAGVGQGSVDASAIPSNPSEMVAATQHLAPVQAVPLQGVMAVPVALSSLQTLATPSSARAHSTQRQDYLLPVQAHDESTEDGTDAESEDSPDHPPERIQDVQSAPNPQVAHWMLILRQAGQQEALRDLALGRQVLLVLTALEGASKALLLGPRTVLEWTAQWWPGSSVMADTAMLTWPRYRLFRDGDLLLRGGLRTRAGAAGCRLLLGTTGQRLVAMAALNTVGALPESRDARLALPDRARLAQALASQWTLLMLVVPSDVIREAAHA
jgi:hypothetical protein